jgi:RNase P protein component
MLYISLHRLLKLLAIRRPLKLLESFSSILRRQRDSRSVNKISAARGDLVIERGGSVNRSRCRRLCRHPNRENHPEKAIVTL